VFLEYKKYDGRKVYLDNDSHINIVVFGRVLFRVHDYRVKEINVVMIISDLARNLVSISGLNYVGVEVFFSNGGCNMLVAKGVHVGTLFHL